MKSKMIMIVVLAVVIVVVAFLVLRTNVPGGNANESISITPAELENYGPTEYSDEIDFDLDSVNNDLYDIESELDEVGEIVPVEQTQGSVIQAPGAVNDVPTSGLYADYNERVAKDYAKSGASVLFFHAGWCPTCRSLDGSLEGANIPNDVAILKVDYDSSSALKRKYKVSYQHTLVHVDENLDLIQSWSGSRNLEEILSYL